MKNILTNRKFRNLAAVVLALALVCSLGAAAFAASGTDHPLTYAAAGRTAQTTAEVYARNVNSTVSISTTASTSVYGYAAVSAGAGSGFIITDDGYILTNFHVVDGADRITVATYGGDRYEAELIGYDSSNDIAVLKIEAAGLTPVTFGNSDEIVVGEDVVAIGNPLGELNFSLTKGVVSALDREVTLSGNMHLRLIQTDCAINSGNSGGALFNMYGEVIGITNAKASSYGYGASVESIAFAIPVNTVVGIVEQIMTKGEISSPYIGISVGNVSENLRAYGVPAGANVVLVTEDSPAAAAGLQKNDVITAANGTPITESDDLVRFIHACSAGDRVVLTVYHQGQTVELTVVVGETVRSALPETSKEQ